MAQYDGSIRIGTKIDTKGFKDGEKEVEADSHRTAESISKTVEKDAQKIEKELENLSDAQKSFLEAGGTKTHPVFQEYEKEIKNLQSALESLQNKQEDVEPSTEHWNQLKIDVEEYAKTLKDMQYLFVKSWLPNTKINGTGTRSADNSANHVCYVSFSYPAEQVSAGRNLVRIQAVHQRRLTILYLLHQTIYGISA